MKVLLDTNVLIGFFRNPRRKEEFESRAHRPLLFMSSIVELFAGCRTPREETALGKFLKPFEKAGRIVTPIRRVFGRPGGHLRDWRVMESESRSAVKS